MIVRITTYRKERRYEPGKVYWHGRNTRQRSRSPSWIARASPFVSPLTGYICWSDFGHGASGTRVNTDRAAGAPDTESAALQGATIDQADQKTSVFESLTLVHSWRLQCRQLGNDSTVLGQLLSTRTGESPLRSTSASDSEKPLAQLLTRKGQPGRATTKQRLAHRWDDCNDAETEKRKTRQPRTPSTYLLDLRPPGTVRD